MSLIIVGDAVYQVACPAVVGVPATVGAEAIVRSLVDAGAVGLITTHDLSLTEIADALGSKATNVHFEDRLDDGKIVFDYQLRPGVVRKSNALALMRSIGLKV